MKLFFPTNLLHLLLLLIESIFHIHIHQIHLLPLPLYLHILLLLLSNMFIFLHHLLPLYLLHLYLDNLSDIKLPHLIYKTMFAILFIPLLILFQITLTIISCLLIILLLSCLYIHILSQKPMLRMASWIVGSKLCKLNC